MKKCIFAVVAASCVGWVASSSRAGITIYSDQSAWQAAVAGLPSTTEPFNATGVQSFTQVSSTDGSIGPARGALSGSVWTDSVSRSIGESTTFSGNSGKQFVAAGMIIDMSPGGDAQGLAFSEFLAQTPSFPFGGVDPVTAGIQQVNGAFFGWTSTDPFTALTITAGPFAGGLEGYDMDNLNLVSLPEPACAIALLPLILLKRQR